MPCSAPAAELVVLLRPRGRSRRSLRGAFPAGRRVARRAPDPRDDGSQLVVSAAIPGDRAPIGLAAMRHGKDFMVDKPGMITLEQLAELRRVQKETGRIFSIFYSEHFSSRVTDKAGELVRAGAIGQVVNTFGLGPHRLECADPPVMVLRARGLWRDPHRHRLPSVRAVPVLHGREGRRGHLCAMANRDNPQTPGLQDFGEMHAQRRKMPPAISASTGSRRTACRSGATGAS